MKSQTKITFTNIITKTPFTNAKLEHVFSRMNQIKTESNNWLGQERLDTQICIGEEGLNIIEFNPDPHIKKWYTKFDASMGPSLEIALQSVKVLIFQLQLVIQSWILHQ